MLLSRILALFFLAVFPAVAQRGGPQNASFSHIHLNAADPAKTIAFWTDLIGATTYSKESMNGVSFQGVLILIAPGAPSGPSAGSAIDRFTIRVPDISSFADKLKGTAYKTSPGEGSDRLIIDGPDGVRIELIEDSSTYSPLQFENIHINSSKTGDSVAWYGKVFGARPVPDDKVVSVRAAGSALIFENVGSVAPSAGRGIDHIAFEVKDLDAFCKKLTADGIKLDSQPQTLPGMKVRSAFLTDPSGARIELTEGLAH